MLVHPSTELRRWTPLTSLPFRGRQIMLLWIAYCSSVVYGGGPLLLGQSVFDWPNIKRNKKMNYLIVKHYYYIFIRSYRCHMATTKQFFVSIHSKPAPLAISHTQHIQGELYRLKCNQLSYIILKHLNVIHKKY